MSATRKKKKNYFPSSFFNAHFIRAQRRASGAPPTGSNSSTASAALPTAHHQSHSQRASFLCTQSKQLLHHRAAEPSAGSACYLRLRTAGSSAVLLRFRVSIDFSASSSTPHKTQNTTHSSARPPHSTEAAALKQQHSSSTHIRDCSPKKYSSSVGAHSRGSATCVFRRLCTSSHVHPQHTHTQLARHAAPSRTTDWTQHHCSHGVILPGGCSTHTYTHTHTRRTSSQVFGVV